MESFRQDLRMALRLLWQQRGFSSTVAITLAVCFGANVALFSVVNHVLLHPLPLPDAERLVIIGNAYPKAGAANIRSVAVPDYYDRLRETTAFSEQALYSNISVNVDLGGTPTRVRAMNVTPSFFRVLQVPPFAGRTFTDDEGEIGGEQKIVLSYGLWQSAFGGDLAIVGRDTRIDGVTYTIVGIMPPEFNYLRPDVMLWRALAFTPRQRSDQSRHSNNYQQIARLQPGSSIKRGQAEIDALNAANLDRFPQFRELTINAGFHTIVTALQDDVVRDVKPSLYLMWAGALFVLFIGGVNVANLVLARSRARLKELATRAALGAGRTRIARQMITESLVLSLLSTAAGVAIGWAALRWLSALNLQDLPRGYEIQLDWTAVGAALVAGVLIGVILGLIPTAGVMAAPLTTMLRDEGRSGTSGRRARLLRWTLVVAQVGFTFILLIGAGLLVASFQHVLAVDPGFEADHVLTASVVLPRARYRDNAAMVTFLDESLARVRALPGVTAAGTTSTVPLGGNNNSSVIFAEGYEMRPGESAVAPAQVNISPGYFEAMGVHLLSGRLFEQRDHSSTPGAATAFGTSQPGVVIVDDRLARHFWGTQAPVGRRMYMPTDTSDMTAITKQTVFIEVVGVVRELKLQSLTQEDQVAGACYFPVAQNMPPPQAPAIAFAYAIKTAGDPATLAEPMRAALTGVDRELAVFDRLTMSERVDRALVSRRSPMVLSISFGVIALFLSAVGVYGVLAYVVAQRTREFGIRLALGSRRAQVFALILREGLTLLAAGFALGIAGAVGLRQSLQSQLFGITPIDPVVMGIVAALLTLVSIAACTLPARRAMRIDPIVALAE